MEEGLALRGRVRYVETLGSTMADLLCRPDPWSQECGRTNCMPCRGSPGRCTQQGVVYCITCITCKLQGVKAHYWGESGRTGYDRGLDHTRDLSAGNKNSPLVTHWSDHHGGEGDPNFQMKVVKQHDRPLSRQIHEGQQIANYKGDIIINRKGEWGNNLPPTLIIEEQEEPQGDASEQGKNGSVKRGLGQPGPET